jgi:hypothetical protein
MSSNNGAAEYQGTPLKYAHLHNTFFVPGYGNVKNKFELKPQDQAGLKAESITLESSQMVRITLKGKDGLVTFLSASTNFDVLVPA